MNFVNIQAWNGEDQLTAPIPPRPARDAERSLHALDREKSESPGRAEAPIGVFDSGAGGLTILSALRQELPRESYIYFGDTAHCPYGVRDEKEIIELSVRIGHFLIEQGVKLIVVACNTVSQFALAALRAAYPSVTFVGVVPAVKPAARATKKGRIGIAATNQAAKAAYLRQLIDEFAGGIQAFAIGCPELVMLVEAGQFDGPLVEETVRQALQPLLREDVDVIVLGCTHFPALRPVIERIATPRVQVIDSGSAIARRTRYVLDTENLIHPNTGDSITPGELQIWCSGNPDKFSKVASKLLGYAVTARQSNT
ncbi:MAG TPA: glutamate racemase [Ktedonobacteraceae bacterium]|nr:glutamate racemase [Ktedonobacteraceae bacterium]